MILVGDIGGTKTILALYEQGGTGWQCHKKQQFLSAEFKTFTALLAKFLNNEEIWAVCIGVAGPVVNGVCNATNLPWILKTSDIAVQVGTKHVVLLNDLEATAWGVLNLPEEDFVELNSKGYAQKQSNLAVLAAGTGLGEAIVTWANSQYHVIATEGGHGDFAPNNEEEILLLQYLMALYPSHVSYERLVSGEGLINIYQFLKTFESVLINEETEEMMLTQDPAAVISQQSIDGKDDLCKKALDIFCRIYGAEAGNLALKSLPYGGVILAGGIVGKILPVIQQGMFMQGFLNKGRYYNSLEKISVKVCTNSEAALFGAVCYATQLLGI